MTTLSITTQLEAIEARAEAATPGKWKARKGGASPIIGHPEPIPAHVVRERITEEGRCISFVAICEGAGCNNDADAELIAHAPDDLKRLTAVVRALRKVVEQVANATVMKSCDAGDCIEDYHKEDCADALAEAARLLGEGK